MYKTRQVQSAQKPQLTQLLQASLLINLLVCESTTMDGDAVYDYIQIVLPETSDTEAIVKAVDYVFSLEIDNIDQRTSGSLRAKLLGTEIDYDDAVLLDAERDCGLLREEWTEVILALAD